MLQSDQRKTKRFDLRLPIELVRMGAEPIATTTETRNVSSGGVLFISESQLPVGEPIEYFITLHAGKDSNNVRLHCVGTVIRLEARPRRTRKDKEMPFNVAATLERYEFIRNNR
ncbi:MAG: PilZ domain-containing protein [Acidimicrobiia bacterium]|nr:PilZ domain-containing protein [Acidimicrobiia bacterium]